MNIHWFIKLIVNHPCVIISATIIFSTTCIIIPFTLRSNAFPSFSDPQLGFSTRGTIISNRLTAYQNLIKDTKPSGSLMSNPNDLFIRKYNNTHSKNKSNFYNNGKNKIRKNKTNTFQNKSQLVVHAKNFDRPETPSDNKWKQLKQLINSDKKSKSNKNKKTIQNSGFCGTPDERYAHVVVKSKQNENLMGLNALLSLCRIEKELVDLPLFKKLCIQSDEEDKKCCKSWSLPNYISLLHGRRSCLGITAQDVDSTLSLLKNCARYFHKHELTQDCEERDDCTTPPECIKHNAVYNILNFLTSTTFLPPSPVDVLNGTFLSETIIFIPVACSVATIPYYHKIRQLDLDYGGISIVGMEFGIKDALFDLYLLRDTWFMGCGTVFIFMCMWRYTGSLFLTLMTIKAIIFSLGISYFVYVFVFEIHFFPFMNLLAIVVAIGIGTDDAFIFCKIFYTVKEEVEAPIIKVMNEAFRHALLSMFVTSLTTSVAFFSSYISSITSVCCFSIFAGTAVIVNCLLMITWFPACLIVYERSCKKNNYMKNCLIACSRRWGCPRFIRPQLNLLHRYPTIENFWKNKQCLLIDLIIDYKYFWIILFTSLTIGSGIIILFYPKLRFPTSNQFQLFDSNHPFEQYEFIYKFLFWFNRPDRPYAEDNVHFKLPLRFVWGILPVDKGDHLNPTALGDLVFDNIFDISQPEAQLWLFNFCKNLRKQPFYYSVFGPLLPNCFIETFAKSMQRNCYDSLANRDRTPCCETSTFPFNSSVFNECIIEEMMDIYDTPSQFLIPGMAGPKFTKDQNPTIKAVVIEYYSNYSYSMSYEYMHEFFTQVEAWMVEELKSAPDSMKNGWFISDVNFFDLQSELISCTLTAIAVSLVLALIVLLLSTLNFFTSLYAIITIKGSIFVTIASLVLCGWKLNILESVAISTAIGLTVDFSLHYTVNYKLCPKEVAINRELATRYALSNMMGPSLMAAITTGAAGAFMMPSSVLPYIQIGIFLITVMFVSWIYATFYLGAILAAIGPENQYGQFHYKQCCCKEKPETLPDAPNQLITSSVSETLELSVLTNKSDIPMKQRPLQRSRSDGCFDINDGASTSKDTENKYMLTNKSPSASSATTIILVDDH